MQSLRMQTLARLLNSNASAAFYKFRNLGKVTDTSLGLSFHTYIMRIATVPTAKVVMRIHGLISAKVLKRYLAHSKGRVSVIYCCVTNYPKA